MPSPIVSPGACLPVLSPTPRRSVKGWLLDEQPVGLWVHWNGKRNVPCRYPTSECLMCPMQARRWKSYTPMLTSNFTQVGVMEFTIVAHSHIHAKVLRDGSVKGELVELERRNMQARGAVCAMFTHWKLSADLLPPPPDVRRTILFLYGYRGDVDESRTYWDSFDTRFPNDLYDMAVRINHNASDGESATHPLSPVEQTNLNMVRQITRNIAKRDPDF